MPNLELCLQLSSLPNYWAISNTLMVLNSSIVLMIPKLHDFKSNMASKDLLIFFLSLSLSPSFTQTHRHTDTQTHTLIKSAVPQVLVLVNNRLIYTVAETSDLKSPLITLLHIPYLIHQQVLATLPPNISQI